MVAHRDVGVADAGSDQEDQNLIGTRFAERDFLDGQRRLLGARDSGSDLHRVLRLAACAADLSLPRSQSNAAIGVGANNNRTEADNLCAWVAELFETKRAW
jgi:hypothetical protein